MLPVCAVGPAAAPHDRSDRMTSARRPGVLMVTGAYFPELSGAGLQCRALISRLRDRVDFTVLTTTADKSLPADDLQDGVRVRRVFVDPASARSKSAALLRFTRAFLDSSGRFSIVHFHGFSQKSVLLMWLAKLTGKRVAIKLTSVGQDDPMSMQRRGGLAYSCYRRADRFFAVSPRFEESYDEAGLPRERFRLIPNGVDTARFRPAAPGEREALRRELNLPPDSRIVLFVGFFSHEKRPDLLFDAWAKTAIQVAPDSALVLVGATRTPYYEIDARLAERIHYLTHALGLDRRVRFVEVTYDIERYHRAADIFVLPSIREGMPNALLEAMASETPCIASRLEGITDAIIHHEKNGLLVPPGDSVALQAALKYCFEDRERARAMGAAARRTVKARFELDVAADGYFNAYCELQDGRRSGSRRGAAVSPSTRGAAETGPGAPGDR
jgi:glycosyltransferase involved in cell wall biosynthesis